MAKQKTQGSNKNQKTTHPGSSAEDAKAVGGKGDFGVPESNVIERTYTSENTRHADPGAATARAGSDGSRTAGVGGHNSGPGSSSGGDLDTDIIGIGNGRGVAASGSVHEPPGPDDAIATSPEKNSKPAPPIRIKQIKGSTVQQTDQRTIAPQGADAASTSETGNDAFAGEVSSDEATGRNDAGD